MKRNLIAAGLMLGMLSPAGPAIAWWQWYFQDVPYGWEPGTWLFQNAPQSATPVQVRPWSWQYQPLPTGPIAISPSAMPLSSLFVSQISSPLGYTVRIRTGRADTQDIEFGLVGHVLTIRKRGSIQAARGVPTHMQQWGWANQWLSLPEDANVAAMRLTRGNGLVEIFVPRTH